MDAAPGGAPRLATTAADFAAAARLQIDFDAEYDVRTPAADELAAHLAALAAGDTRVWLVGEPPQGHGIVRLRTQTLVDEPEAYLAELYVVPTRRGEGLGSRLLQAIIDDARALGATYMDLGTNTEDRQARALYEKFGFDCREGREQGPVELYYQREL